MRLLLVPRFKCFKTVGEIGDGKGGKFRYGV